MKVADPLAGVAPAPPLPPTAASKGRGSVEPFDATLTAAAEASHTAPSRKSTAKPADASIEAPQADDDEPIDAPTDEQAMVDPATSEAENVEPTVEVLVAPADPAASTQQAVVASSSSSTSSSVPARADAVSAVLQDVSANTSSVSSAPPVAVSSPSGTSAAAANQPTHTTASADAQTSVSPPSSRSPITHSPSPTIRSESSPVSDAAASAPANNGPADDANLDTGAHADAQSDDAHHARLQRQVAEQAVDADPSNTAGPHDAPKASAHSAGPHDGGDSATGRIAVPTHAPLEVDLASAGAARPAAAANHTANPSASAVSVDGATTTGLAQVDADRVADRALRGLQGAVNQRGGTVTLRLSPPELGALKIRVQMDGLTVRAQFEAANHAVRQLLHQQMGQLRLALESQGLTVDQLQVQQTQPPQDASNAGGGQDADQPDDGRSRGSFDDPTRGGDQSSRDDRRAPSGDLSRFQRELLDLIA